MTQEALMKFDPATGEPQPYPSHAKQYRDYHGQVAWLFCPWSGRSRDARNIGSDTFGHLISDGSVLRPFVPKTFSGNQS